MIFDIKFFFYSIKYFRSENKIQKIKKKYSIIFGKKKFLRGIFSIENPEITNENLITSAGVLPNQIKLDYSPSHTSAWRAALCRRCILCTCWIRSESSAGAPLSDPEPGSGCLEYILLRAYRSHISFLTKKEEKSCHAKAKLLHPFHPHPAPHAGQKHPLGRQHTMISGSSHPPLCCQAPAWVWSFSGAHRAGSQCLGS